MNEKLASDPPTALLDYGLAPLTGFTFGEYCGIDSRGGEVWTSFNGTWEDDPGPDGDLSVIWSSRIIWSP